MQVLAIMDGAAINIHVRVFVWPKLPSALGKYQGAQLLARMLTVCSAESGPPCCPPGWLWHSAFPPAMSEKFRCSTPAPAPEVVSALGSGCANESIVEARLRCQNRCRALAGKGDGVRFCSDPVSHSLCDPLN